ncbi:MAG: hypothetical protein A3D44_02135 [Candidatus Staskawiczbacteria bacterium RIFCSPHIGHO2_02_FULL_42_22]|uniref:Uncharacterized protein n=1 Tax=Candidatus Staskawiczbacteria bacterium RIFCSPHIGHO2_02_FULL_42_22 TaxID=1802207 RepID=A0A1G2I1X6_9BACT|nr:MAG: hypothetical protein A3D44_02135 [Candidatus Staskawiczbacteria bacterium RIFCSPHIGHO2_02_FULL_42_22]
MACLLGARSGAYPLWYESDEQQRRQAMGMLPIGNPKITPFSSLLLLKVAQGHPSLSRIETEAIFRF